MANPMTTKKTVKISENALVDLIDNIVNETVAIKKTEWLNEHKKVENSKTSILENKVNDLEKKLNLLINKKA